MTCIIESAVIADRVTVTIQLNNTRDTRLSPIVFQFLPDAHWFFRVGNEKWQAFLRLYLSRRVGWFELKTDWWCPSKCQHWYKGYRLSVDWWALVVSRQQRLSVASSTVPTEMANKFTDSFSNLRNQTASKCKLFIWTITSFMLLTFADGRPTFDGILLDVDTKGKIQLRQNVRMMDELHVSVIKLLLISFT